MTKESIVELQGRDLPVEDPLTEVLRRGARALLSQAVEAEVGPLA